MKRVKKRFLKLVMAKYPDGGIGCEADFVELLKAKEYMMHFIKTNRPEENEEDEDETLSRNDFDEANMR